MTLLAADRPLSLPDPLDLARAFAARLGEIDRDLRGAGLTVAPPEVRAEVVDRFWGMMAVVDQVEARGGSTAEQRARFREALGGWMWRSRLWNRSFHKPHGYAGEYQMIEWMYDLEGDECQDPTQPAIVNCLDHLYATVDSVAGVIERRRFFSALLARVHARLGGKIRVLDVASGGARYIRDYLRAEGDVSAVEVTLVDQDPAAVAFCRTRALLPWAARVCALCAPVKALDTAPLGRAYDVVLSAGLLDDLDDARASALLASLAGRLSPGGVLAISNFHPADRSRSTKDWVVDWRLVFRDEPACARLFPRGLAVETSRSENRALTYALGRKPV